MKRKLHDSGKIEFPGLILKKIKYLETLVSQIGRNRVFSSPICGKFAHTKLDTLETWISRLGKIAFSGLKNEENFHSLFDVDFTNRQKSHFQAAKMREICSHEAWYL